MPVSDIVRPASLEERSLSASSIDVEQTVSEPTILWDIMSFSMNVQCIL